MRLNQYRKDLLDLRYKENVERMLDAKVFGATAEEKVDFAMNVSGGFLRPIQNVREITTLYRFVEQRCPRRVLEIGTAKGGSLFLLCQAAADDATICSIDLPLGRNGGGYPAWKTPIYKKFAKSGQRLELLRTNSHLPESRDMARSISPEGYDLIMIDADHSYDGVKTDYMLYSPLLAPEGVIVLHDILPNRFDPEIEVDRFWNEIQSSHKTLEIVDSYDQGNLGLGVVFGPKSASDSCSSELKSQSP
jgi:predicted O-methyltransferase YrrM